jgi:thymidylate synthase (FAD)
MTVNLISYTQSASGLSLTEQVSYVARVSNPANQNNMDTSDRLIRYLIKNQHWSPFEMVSVCLDIQTTRDIARQILRHRSFSFQEFSQRYAKVAEPMVFRDARLQDNKNRQNSVVTDDEELMREWRNVQDSVQNATQWAYEWALENGIAKEQARVVLPEGMTPSRIYMNGTLRSWIHYIQLRSANGTQQEHREIAIQCANAIEGIFPMIKEFISE